MQTHFFVALSIVSTFLLSLNAAEIDWDKAQTLHRKSKQGQTLTNEEKDYLEKAMAARSGGSRPNRPDPTRGDGTGEKATVDPVRISESDSPVKTLTATASDGNKIDFAYRAPKSNRSLPAIIFIHGSLGQRRIHDLVDNLKSGPTPTRFLAAGYVCIAATFRTYGEEPLSEGPILDTVAIVETVKSLPEVDPESVVIFGTSGGGHLALELAACKELSFPAVVIGEPASILFTGLMTGIAMREPAMRDYRELYTEEHRRKTEAKIANFSCPILVHHGDRHPLRKINFDIVFPAIKDAGKSITIEMYPGEDHGFYWGNRTSEATVEKVVKTTRAFIDPLLKTKPAT